MLSLAVYVADGTTHECRYIQWNLSIIQTPIFGELFLFQRLKCMQECHD